MKNNRFKKRSIYILLSALLGSLLFITIYRAFSLLYFFLIIFNVQKFGFGLTNLQLQLVDSVLFFIVTGAGLWYGVWLGSHWYEYVYAAEAKKQQFSAGHGNPFRFVRVKARAAEQYRDEHPWDLDELMKHVPDTAEGNQAATVVAHKSAKARSIMAKVSRKRSTTVNVEPQGQAAVSSTKNFKRKLKR